MGYQPTMFSFPLLFLENQPSYNTLPKGDECYRVSQTTLNWYQAQEDCWGQNGFLAEIKSEEQQKRLEGFLPYDTNFWIGLNDIANDGDFVWAESHQSVDYTNWHPGQPDNGSGDEDCVHIIGRQEDQFSWNDVPCAVVEVWDLPVHALCQYNS